VRDTVENAVYAGWTELASGGRLQGDHEPLINPERWGRIVTSVKRLDPVAVRSRRKGRKPAENYLLRGIATCGACGSALYTRRYKRIPGERAYVCGAVREARGTCSASPIPAEPVGGP
jgi:hypothetical protein